MKLYCHRSSTFYLSLIFCLWFYTLGSWLLALTAIRIFVFITRCKAVDFIKLQAIQATGASSVHTGSDWGTNLCQGLQICPETVWEFKKLGAWRISLFSDIRLADADDYNYFRLCWLDVLSCSPCPAVLYIITGKHIRKGASWPAEK